MAGESELIWNPFSKGYFENPYVHLAECREKNPVHKALDNSWFFFNHQDIYSILRLKNTEVSNLSEYFKEKEPYLFSNSNACPFLAQGTKLWPMYLNGDIHKQIRLIIAKVLNQLFTEEIILESIEKCNQNYKHKKEFDLVDFCSTFIFYIIEKLLGITNYESEDEIRKYSNLLARSQDLFIPKQIYLIVNEALLKGKTYFADSPYKQLIEKEAKAQGLVNLTEDDLYSLMSITLMAAFETSKDNLSVALYELLKNKPILKELNNYSKEETDLLIEELFRFSSPLQYTVRIPQETIEINGIQIEKGSKLYLCLASGNRDPKVFENPNQLIYNRNPNPHLSFGGGVHFCLGAEIARQEMRVCLKPFAQLLQNFEIKGDGVKWGKQIFMRTAERILIAQ